MRVLLVDDHPLILSALRHIIHGLDASIQVLTAENPHDTFALLAVDAEVDLVLLDLNLGQAVDGFAVLADLRVYHPALPVVVVSATERLSDMVRVIDMGAMGFVSKCSSTRELSEALALVLSGGVYIPPALLGLARTPGVNLAAAAAAADAAASQRAQRWLAGQGAHTGVSPAMVTHVVPHVVPAALTLHDPAVLRPMPVVGEPAVSAAAGAWAGAGAGATVDRAGMAGLGLTPRQSDVLTLLLKGLPNKLIARELNVSVETVKDHVAAVLRALGVGSRTQAVLVVSRLSQGSAARA